MPLVLALTGDKSDASLIAVCRIGAEDIVGVCGPRVDAATVGLKRNASFGGDTKVNSLKIEATTEFRQSAVPAILNVVGGEERCQTK